MVSHLLTWPNELTWCKHLTCCGQKDHCHCWPRRASLLFTSIPYSLSSCVCTEGPGHISHIQKSHHQYKLSQEHGSRQKNTQTSERQVCGTSELTPKAPNYPLPPETETQNMAPHPSWGIWITPQSKKCCFQCFPSGHPRNLHTRVF